MFADVSEERTASILCHENERCHTPEEINLHTHRRESLTSNRIRPNILLTFLCGEEQSILNFFLGKQSNSSLFQISHNPLKFNSVKSVGLPLPVAISIVFDINVLKS
jgi:hypothetical protein